MRLTPEEIQQLVQFFEILIEWDQQENQRTKDTPTGEAHEGTLPVPTAQNRRISKFVKRALLCISLANCLSDSSAF